MPTNSSPVSFVTLFSTRRRFVQTTVIVLLFVSALTLVAQYLELQTITRVATITLDDATSLRPSAQLKHHFIQPTRAPHNYSDAKTMLKCYVERDVGIIAAIQENAKHFCVHGGWNRATQTAMSLNQATKVSLFRIGGGLRSTTFENLMLDLSDVAIHSPINQTSMDGYTHDPRFRFNLKLINCVCDELVEYFQSLANTLDRQEQQIWRDLVAALPKTGTPLPTMCSSQTWNQKRRSAWDFVKSPLHAPDKIETVVFHDPVILLARRDDHNPFFQISYALNAWVMLQALKWDRTKTRVIHLDGGFPSAIDALQKGLLAPNHEIVEGATLRGKRVHFRGTVLAAPFEFSGLLMQHLDDDEPCYDSELIKTFRTQSLQIANITLEVERQFGASTIRPMIVTIITRRPYRGRNLERQWENEDDVMAAMRLEYKALDVTFRSIEYTNLTLHEQMVTTLESDMIIGMHGAGLVNVLWARPMTTVVEIFPKQKNRWGFRNICRFVGCDWHQFRGGNDSDPTWLHKYIPRDEWMVFFDPLFQETYTTFKKQQAVLREEKAP